MKIFSKNSNYNKYYKEFIPLIKKEKSQKYLFIILSITASIFFLIFAINPTLSTIGNLRKQIADAKEVDKLMDQKIANLSSLSVQYQELEANGELGEILEAVPQSPEVPTLIGQIRAIGEASSVDIDNVEVFPVILTSSEGASRSSSFIFDVSGTSGFEESREFLENLIKMQRALIVETIQITKSKQGIETINFVYKGKAYFKN